VIEKRVSTGNEWELRYGYSRARELEEPLMLMAWAESMSGDATPQTYGGGFAQATGLTPSIASPRRSR